MQYLQSLLDNTNAPVLYAFLLGLMTAISPCPLATNITAIAYISKDIEIKRRIFINGLIYTLGRAFSYTAIGVILYFGASKFQVARFFQLNGEKYIGPLLIIIGVLMLDIVKIKFPSFGKYFENFQDKNKGKNWLNSFCLGPFLPWHFALIAGFYILDAYSYDYFKFIRFVSAFNFCHCNRFTGNHYCLFAGLQHFRHRQFL